MYNKDDEPRKLATVEALLKAGANVSAYQNIRQGKPTALSRAKTGNFSTIVAVLRAADDGWTASRLAEYYNFPTIAAALRAAGATETDSEASPQAAGTVPALLVLLMPVVVPLGLVMLRLSSL